MGNGEWDDGPASRSDGWTLELVESPFPIPNSRFPVLLDARTLPDASSHDADVCVVGAGAAGIAIARELARESVRVCLLESGGLEPSRRAQALADGDRRGDPYPPLDEMRVRALGGTTARWTGWCRRLDAIDFERRPWVPHAGWPFDRARLAPFYERAAALVEVSDAGGDWLEGDARDADPAGLAPVEFRCSPPTHLGRAHRAELERSATAHVWLNATVVAVDIGDEERSVRAVRVRAAAGREVRVRARCFVLAAGGIENARLLLASTEGRRVKNASTGAAYWTLDV